LIIEKKYAIQIH